MNISHLYFIAGWGRVEEGNTKKPTILQQVQLPVISNAECKQKYSVLGGPFKPEIQEKFDSDVVVCAGYAEGGKDTCQGDSGGPLMLPEFMNGKFPYFQIGVNSYGTPVMSIIFFFWDFIRPIILSLICCFFYTIRLWLCSPQCSRCLYKCPRIYALD